tara:strand:+ start:75 stop:404 length:330 start_codon:yes stop_codon:yes gene_type:complete
MNLFIVGMKIATQSKKGQRGKSMTIKYIAITKEWFDKVNGNSYFSVQIEDIEKDVIYKLPFEYGYGTQSEFVVKEFLGLKGFNSDLPIKFIKIENCLKKEVIEHGGEVA